MPEGSAKRVLVGEPDFSQNSKKTLIGAIDYETSRTCINRIESHQSNFEN